MKKLSPNERRKEIMDILNVCRHEKIANLASRFGVSYRTVYNDIEELTLAYPLETVKGRYGGGVRIADGYYLGRKYLKPSQQKLLRRLAENLTGEDLDVMNSIFADFSLSKKEET